MIVGGTAGGTKLVEVTGSGANYNVAVSGMTSSGTVIATIPAGVAQDSAGNWNIASTSTDNSVAYDTTIPTVTGVTSNTANGTYGAGTVIDVRVSFSETVNVTGTPQLLLETGTTDRNATYASGSGSTTLVFNYTVQTGDMSNDLDYVATSSLTLNGGTIKDVAGNNAALTLPSPGAAGSLSANKNIIISTLTSIAVTPVNPTVQVGATQQFTATGTYSNGGTQNITGSVAWASSNTSVVTITSAGLATGMNPGSTIISATLSGITGNTGVTVQPLPLTITTASLANGTQNVAYSATLAANGGTLPYTWSIREWSASGVDAEQQHWGYHGNTHCRRYLQFYYTGHRCGQSSAECYQGLEHRYLCPTNVVHDLACYGSPWGGGRRAGQRRGDGCEVPF